MSETTFDFSQFCGYTPDPVKSAQILATMPYPVFAQAAPNLVGDLDKDIYLYKAWKDVIGSYPNYVAQQIGDCTSFGAAHAVDLLECIQISIGKQNQEYKETCSEAIYGCAREIAGMLHSWGDGCFGSATAKACTTDGIIPREDVGAYSGNRAKQWGNSGTPADIKSKMSQHKIKTTSLVQTWADLCGAISNGYPVTVASNQGFTMTRNSKGICEAQGHWGHQMMICGIMYVGTQDECAVISQSWGNNVPSGPTPNDMPNFTFGARRRVVESMLANQDSYAYSSFDGYPGQNLPEHWTYAGWSGFGLADEPEKEKEEQKS